jgi:hypothetical protein
MQRGKWSSTPKRALVIGASEGIGIEVCASWRIEVMRSRALLVTRRLIVFTDYGAQPSLDGPSKRASLP